MELKIDAQGKPAMATNVLNPSGETRVYQAVLNLMEPNAADRKCRKTVRELGRSNPSDGEVIWYQE